MSRVFLFYLAFSKRSAAGADGAARQSIRAAARQSYAGAAMFAGVQMA
jgi:hypothetical protein